MPLFNEEQIEKIYKILNLDEGFTVNKLYETRKNNTEINNKNQERRPSWSSNTNPIKKPLIECSYPIGTELSSTCRCTICDEDYKQSKIEFLNFKNEFLLINNIDELNTFEKNINP